LGEPDGPRISIKVMLLTPAFPQHGFGPSRRRRRVGGASNLRPLQSHLAVDDPRDDDGFALQLLRVFNPLKRNICSACRSAFSLFDQDFHLDSEIKSQLRRSTVLASLTLLMIALIIPLQRWILERRRYTTITGSFVPA